MGVMQYLLDTNICIYIAKNKPPKVYARFANLKVGQVGMSIITFGELWYGVHKSQQVERCIQKLMELTRLIPIVTLNMETARYFGVIRSELEQKGMPIGNNALWIAAHAVESNLILVTNNTREFERIPNLKLENWVL